MIDENLILAEWKKKLFEELPDKIAVAKSLEDLKEIFEEEVEFIVEHEKKVNKKEVKKEVKGGIQSDNSM